MAIFVRGQVTMEAAPRLESSNKSGSIIISGITGHVGRELSRQLLLQGVKVHGLTRQDPSSISEANEGIALHRIDGRTESLVRLFQRIRPECVVHLAALARRDHLISDVEPFMQANVLYGAQILEAMRFSGCKCLITAESNLQFSEAGDCYPLNLYAATKHAFVSLLQYYVDAFNVTALALVLPTIYSEWERGAKLMTDTASALQRGTILTLQVADVLIDFVHVQDVATAFVTAARRLQVQAHNSERQGSFGRFSVTSGTDTTPLELIAAFERVGDCKVKIQVEPTTGISRRRKPWHGPVLPGWSPKVDLETGIKRMLSLQR